MSLSPPLRPRDRRRSGGCARALGPSAASRASRPSLPESAPSAPARVRDHDVACPDCCCCCCCCCHFTRSSVAGVPLRSVTAPPCSRCSARQFAVLIVVGDRTVARTSNGAHEISIAAAPSLVHLALASASANASGVSTPSASPRAGRRRCRLRGEGPTGGGSSGGTQGSRADAPGTSDLAIGQSVKATCRSGQLGRRARALGGPASQGPAAGRPPRPGQPRPALSEHALDRDPTLSELALDRGPTLAPRSPNSP